MRKSIVYLTLIVLLLTGCARNVDVNINVENSPNPEIDINSIKELDGREKNETENFFSDENDQDLVTKVDYPLLDIYFSEEDKWIILNAVGLYQGNEEFLVISGRDGSFIEWMKEYMRVLTFPVGRGITPDGLILVYKNGKLIKNIPYGDIHIVNKDFEDAFQKVNREDILVPETYELAPKYQ